jgi:predicted RND superfamily exporter protein
MIRRYVSFIISRPKTVIAIVAMVSVFLGFSISKVKMLLDVDDQLPPDNAYVKVSKRVEKLFGGKFITVVGFYPEKGTIYTPEILGKVKRVTEALEKVPGVKPGSVISLMSPRVKDIVSTEETIEITPLATTVPTNDVEMAAFRKHVEHSRAITSLLVPDDGRATVVIADFDNFEKAGGAKKFYPYLERILDQERVPGLDIVTAGSPSVLYWLTQYTKRMAGLFVLALIVIAILLYSAFRSLQGMFLPLVTALLGVIWALGLMGLVKAPLDPWNAMTPILLLAIGAGHSVQILKRYYEEFGRLKAERPDADPRLLNREAIIEATTKVGAVMLTAGSIASLSFASLVAMGLPSMKNFGLCTAFGILAALTILMSFIPAVQVLLPPPTAKQTERERRKAFFDPILAGLARIVRERKEKPIIWVFFAVIIIAAIGMERLETRNSLGAQFFKANGPTRGFTLADERTAGTRVVQVLVEGKAVDAIKDPEILKRMDELSQYINQLKFSVGKVVSIVDVLKVMNRVFDNDNPKSEVLPSSMEAVSQYLFAYAMSGDEGDLRRLVDADYQRAVITVYIRTDDQNEMKQLVTAMEKKAASLFKGLPVDVSVGGGVTNAIALNETIVRGKIYSLIQIAAIVLLITSFALRSFVGGLLVLLPLATAALVNLGLMGWAGIWLSMGTAAISAMAVGIGADYAIYFIFRTREELRRTGDLREAVAVSLTTSGKAIAYVAIAVAVGYLCLALSLFKVHVLLGVLVALTMVSCSGATLVFLPAVLLRLSPRFLTREIGRKS